MPLYGQAQFVSQISSDVLVLSNDLAVDDAGNVYITGSFDGTASFQGSLSLSSIGLKDIFIAKFSPAGQVLWAFSIGGIAGGPGVDDEGLAIDVSPAGNLFVTGYFQGTADFDPGAGVTEATSHGFRDAFLASYTSAGQLRWVESFGGEADDRGQDVTIYQNDAVYFTGFFRQTAQVSANAGSAMTSTGEEDGYLLSLDQSGNHNWGFGYGDISVDKGSRLDVDGSGNVYLAGLFSRSADFDPGPDEFLLSSLSNSQDGVLASYSPAGALRHAMPLGSPQLDGIAGLAVDDNGDAYITGNFIGTLNFDPLNDPQNIVSLGIDQYIARYTPAGDLAWVYTLGSGFAQGSDIAINNDQVLVTGVFGDNLLPDPGSTLQISSQGEQDIMLASYTKAGEFRWGHAIGGVLSEAGTAVALDAAGQAYVTGFFQDDVDFDPAAPAAILSSAGIYDGFLVRYAPDGSLPVSNETPAQIDSDLHVTTFPNPATDRVTVSVTTSWAWPVELAVFDVLGRQIKLQVDRQTQNGKTDFDLHVSDLHAGLYFVRASIVNRHEVVSFTVVK